MKPTEKKLYDFLKLHDGMTLFEEDIRNNLGISHGTFSAARKALVDAGTLFMERRGKAVFYRILPETAEVKETSILPQTSDETSTVKASLPVKTSPPKTSLPAKKPPKTSTPKTSDLPLADGEIEPVTGYYADFDDWFLALTRAYGDVDAEELNGGKYLVTIFEPFATMKYETYFDDEGSFVVNLA